MPRYKVLKAVAHNIGHSFTSLMNFANDDYIMGHILSLARRSGCGTLTIDFVSGKAKPPELLAEPVSRSTARYIEWFWKFVEREGSDRSYVRSASLTLHYDISIERPHPSWPGCTESPYRCDVLITDVRGKDYSAHFEGWWYPELSAGLPGEKTNRWWKFWDRKRENGSKIVP